MDSRAEIIVQLHGADGQPWKSGPATIQILDPFRQGEKELISHTTSKNHVTFPASPPTVANATRSWLAPAATAGQVCSRSSLPPAAAPRQDCS